MLKEPWEVFFELYREAAAKQSHESAVVNALTNTIYDWNDRDYGASGNAMARLITALEDWRSSGSPGWPALQSRLRDAWTDWVLEHRRGW